MGTMPERDTLEQPGGTQQGAAPGGWQGSKPGQADWGGAGTSGYAGQPQAGQSQAGQSQAGQSQAR
jgi:hypothetical protein